MNKIRLAILRNEVPDDHLLWVAACQEVNHQVEWEVVDITRQDWLERTLEGRFDGLLATPSCFTMPFKILSDERIGILNQVCGIPVYPSLQELLIYENKKFLAYWLAANEIPHPETWVFYYRKEALDFLAGTDYPIVGKSNIGASGRGVVILKDQDSARKYVQDTFSGKGAVRSVGPNWRKKGFLKRVIKKLLHPAQLRSKLEKYSRERSDIQKDFVLLQRYVPHQFEWRCVRIGDSFFAHKKIKKGEKASGTLLKGYENPPLRLLDFVREITDRKGLFSQAVDLFVTADGRYLVNEMQCIFGQSDPYQMLVDGDPGRYRFSGGEWVFEKGDFNRHESFLLRVEHFLEILSKRKKLVS